MTDSSHSVLQSHRIREVMVKVMIGQLKIVGNFFTKLMKLCHYNCVMTRDNDCCDFESRQRIKPTLND